jgi:translation initiation factor IF-1
MVNKKGGKEYKKYKSRSKEQQQVKLISKDDYPGSIYAKVNNLLGGNRLLATGENKKTYNCVIRGRLLNKDRMIKGDYILIYERDFEKNEVTEKKPMIVADICHKCSRDEIEHFEIDNIFEFLELSDNPFQNGNDIVFETNDINNEFDFEKL